MPIGPYEGFVVETCGQNPMEEIQRALDITLSGRPGVYRTRLHSIDKWCRRCRAVWQLYAVQGDVEDRTRIIEPSPPDPSGAMVFEAAPHDAHATCQQRRGERVTGMASVVTPVKSKAQDFGAINQTARRQSACSHDETSLRKARVSITSMVTVSRHITNISRHVRWTQTSSAAPFSLR